MSADLKFIALTSSDVGAGTVLNYLLRTTPLRLAKVYSDTMEERARPVATMPANPGSPEAPGRTEKVRYHLGLLRAMPRSHGLRIVERLTGRSVLSVLRHCERLDPRLLALASGVSAPVAPWGGRVLHTLAEVTRRHRIPIVRTPSLNNPATVADLAADSADVLLGLGTRILSSRVLATARLGVLNAHSSLLPDYRGGTTEFWQLTAGEKSTGVTIHWMAPRVDEGAICAQRSWTIPQGADHHQLRLMSLFNRLGLWREVVETLISGQVPRIPQATARTPTFKHPGLKQEHEFYCNRNNRE
jgi:hypothetical protein